MEATTIKDGIYLTESKRKVFLKNKKYICQGMIVICTKTTCNFSGNVFKAIYIGLSGDYQIKEIKFTIGQKITALCDNYELYDKEIIL